MSNEELIKELCEQSTDLCNEAAAVIAALAYEVEDLERILCLMKSRKGYVRYVEYWRKKKGKSDLCYPDGDQVYRDFWEQKERADRLEKELKEYKMKESWEKFPDMMGKC